MVRCFVSISCNRFLSSLTLASSCSSAFILVLCSALTGSRHKALAAKSSTVQRKISAAVPDPQYTHSLCAHWNRPLAQHVYLSVAFSLKLFSRADSFFSSSLHSASQLSKCCCAEAGARSSGRRAFTAGAHACTDTILGTQKGMPDTCTFPAKFCSPARGPCSLIYSC